MINGTFGTRRRTCDAYARTQSRRNAWQLGAAKSDSLARVRRPCSSGRLSARGFHLDSSAFRVNVPVPGSTFRITGARFR
jgi:hypothetical protein